MYCAKKTLFSRLLLLIGFTFADAACQTAANSECRNLPGDACWPCDEDWKALNSSVDGRLIATKPLAAACHDDEYATYDEVRCTALRAGWLDPETQSVMSIQ